MTKSVVPIKRAEQCGVNKETGKWDVTFIEQYCIPGTGLGLFCMFQII